METQKVTKKLIKRKETRKELIERLWKISRTEKSYNWDKVRKEVLEA